MTYQKTTSQTSRKKPDRIVGPLLTALGDATRREIIERLRGGPRTVGELSDLLPVSRPAVSQHLKVLRDAGAVIETRKGVRHYFALDAVAIDALRSHFERMWQDVLLSFANHVKESERAHKRN
jgi:DNA-binding transcriptional ArsR family regulator